ncbi:hypothetical protein DFI02_1042 [Rhizobium sp. PP-F2F-G20b]|nr:hypothetical protein DFI02_1042 [Rhizobium sp. PP-F2F-G20b]
MLMANSHYENSLIVFNLINDEVRFERMYSDGRLDLIPLARDAWIGSYQIK